MGNIKPLVMGLALIATLGGLLFGYDTAVISGAVSAIDVNFINPRNLDEASRLSLSGFTVSSALWGCVIGGAIAGTLGDRFGRRAGLMFSAVLFLIGSLGSAWPEFGIGEIGKMGADALTPFNVYRILGGVGVGIASLLSPLYIAEISPHKERGRLVSVQQLSIMIGMLLVYFVNMAIAARGDDQYLHTVAWRWMLASEAIPAALFLGLLFFIPESPRWLVMKGRHEEAAQVLHRLTDEAESKVLLREIDESLREKQEPLFAYGALVVVVGIMLSVFQQFVGINAVLYYAPQMFQNMGASTNSSFLQTVVVGITNLVFTVVAMLTVDKWGRKPLLITGALVMAVSMLCLGYLFNTGSMGAMSLAMVLLYIVGFALSWGPIVWVMLAEIFPNPIKGRALGIAVAVQWLANLLVSWSFKILDGSSSLNAIFHHGFAYYVYGVMGLLAALFVWRFVPETNGHRLEQIHHLWKPKAA